MGNIIAIAADVDELYRTSLGTILTFIERGYAAYMLVVKQEEPRTEEERLSIKKQCKRVGISDVFFIDGFDYSSVTQHNADLINSFIKMVNPSIVTIPYWRTANFSRKILAKCALIACRGIGTILMYPVNSEKDPDYIPTVFVRVSADAALIKERYAKESLQLGSFHPKSKVMAEYDSSPPSGAGEEECEGPPADMKGKDRDANHDTSVELFESHRMLLVNNETGW